MQIPQIVQAYIDACSPRTFDIFLSMFAPDATYSDPGTPQPLPPPGIKAYLGGLFAAFPDTVFETVAIYPISDNLFVWRWIMHGTNTGSFAGMPPTQKSITLPGCEFVTLANGKVQHVEGYFDQVTMLRQMGLMPPR